MTTTEPTLDNLSNFCKRILTKANQALPWRKVPSNTYKRIVAQHSKSIGLPPSSFTVIFNKDGSNWRVWQNGLLVVYQDRKGKLRRYRALEPLLPDQ
jgi:hypothetical protein